MAFAKARLDWLEDARAALNADPGFRRLGSADMTLGLALGDDAVLVRFEAFEIAAVEHVAAGALRDADLVLEMSPREWNGYLQGRRSGRGDSLLSLALDRERERPLLRAASPLRRLLFERYNRTLQAFIDKGAALAG